MLVSPNAAIDDSSIRFVGAIASILALTALAIRFAIRFAISASFSLFDAIIAAITAFDAIIAAGAIRLAGLRVLHEYFSGRRS